MYGCVTWPPLKPLSCSECVWVYFVITIYKSYFQFIPIYFVRIILANYPTGSHIGKFGCCNCFLISCDFFLTLYKGIQLSDHKRYRWFKIDWKNTHWVPSNQIPPLWKKGQYTERTDLLDSQIFVNFILLKFRIYFVV